MATSTIRFNVRGTPINKINSGKVHKFDSYVESVETSFEKARDKAAALNALAATGDKDVGSYYYSVDSFEPARGC